MLRLSTSIAKSGHKVGIGTQNVLLMRHGQANTCRELAGVIGIPTCNGSAPAEVAKPPPTFFAHLPLTCGKRGKSLCGLVGLLDDQFLLDFFTVATSLAIW